MLLPYANSRTFSPLLTKVGRQYGMFVRETETEISIGLHPLEYDVAARQRDDGRIFFNFGYSFTRTEGACDETGINARVSVLEEIKVLAKLKFGKANRNERVRGKLDAFLVKLKTEEKKKPRSSGKRGSERKS